MDYAEFDAVAKLVEDYFSAAYRASEAAPPPGKNAANGYFRGYLLDWLPALPNLPAPPTDPRALKIVQARDALRDGVHSTLARCANYHARLLTHLGIVTSTFEQFWQEIGGVVVAAFAALGGSGEGEEDENDEEQEDLAKALETLFNAISNSPIVFGGTHANGWISGGVDNTGETAARFVDVVEFREPPVDAYDRLGTIIRAVAGGYRAINNKVHRPWLRADWQVEFEGLNRTGYVAVRRLRLNEAETFAAQGNALTGDAARVAASQRHEVRHFAKRNGLTEEEVLALIDAVGNDRRTLEAEIARRRISGEKFIEILPEAPNPFAAAG